MAIYPFEEKHNQYINVVKRVIEQQGLKVVDYEKVKKNDRIDFVILNWYENSGLETMHKKIFNLLLYRIQGVSIFYVFHNKQPHDGRALKVKKMIMRIMLHLCSCIIILSKDSVNYLPKKVRKKIAYIPHPNYLNCYNIDEFYEAEKNNEHQMKFLFVGAVRPYKNIEILINAFKTVTQHTVHQITLTIAGKVIDNEYKKTIETIIKDSKNIKVLFEFIPDSELPNLIKQHDILVLPYDYKSSLNSGTAFLAFSFQRTVIAPLIATIKEFDLSLVYAYDYANQEEHYRMLTAKMFDAVNDFYSDKNIVLYKGNQIFNCVKKSNSEMEIGKKYKELFEKFAGKEVEGDK